MQDAPDRGPAGPDGLLVAGATGQLGQEVLRQFAGRQPVQVLARAAATGGLRSVTLQVVAGEDPDQWPAGRAGTAIVLFERPRPGDERDRLLWTPTLGQLPALARWLRRSGVRTLAIVLPHAQGRLPEALKHGLASLDEQVVASLGFERLLIVRSAQKPHAPGAAGLPERLAEAMLSIFKYMVPSNEQPVRSSTLAQFLAAALAAAPPGIHVAAPELVWRAAQGDIDQAVRGWLRLG